jgi:hypothetical protein
MAKSGQTIAVAACGLVSSVVVALLDAWIAKRTGFDLFTFGVWIILPVGASACGALAASGYVAGSFFSHRAADRGTFVHVILIAMFTQWLIYYLGYRMASLDDGTPASGVVAFGEYLDVVLTTAHMKVGRAMEYDTGTVGTWGYAIAALHFAGFLLGGGIAWAWLRGRPRCDDCSLYTRQLHKRTKQFRNAEQAQPFLNELFSHAPGTPGFTQLISGELKTGRVKPGAVKLSAQLHACPGCKDYLVLEQIEVFNGKHWREVPGGRRQWVDHNVPGLARAFR